MLARILGQSFEAKIVEATSAKWQIPPPGRPVTGCPPDFRDSLGLALRIITVVNGQYSKLRAPRLITLLAIVTFVRLVLLNASAPMLATLLGMATLVSLLQFSNAESPMVVTLLGIV